MLRKVNLSDFRNYAEKEFVFEDGVNVIFGENARGKTNLLEAISLLGMGESFRAKLTDEMVKFEKEYGKVSGTIVWADDEQQIEVIVNKGVIMGKSVNKRKYLIDGVSKRKTDLLGILPLVLFRPEDVELVSGSPDMRRKFLDRMIVQTSPEYAHSLQTYEQALRRRNKLLVAIREGQANRHSLTFWDGLLIKHGQVVQELRTQAIDYINEIFEKSDLFKKLKVSYDRSAISESRLLQYKDAEVSVGYTLVGPHKDDFMVMEKDRDLAIYGSRGEQRMAVLALKMGEIYYLEGKSNRKTLLLLDDIFSELDDTHKQEVLRVMMGRQVIVTTADEDDLKMFEKANKIDLTLI